MGANAETGSVEPFCYTYDSIGSRESVDYAVVGGSGVEMDTNFIEAGEVTGEVGIKGDWGNLEASRNGGVKVREDEAAGLLKIKRARDGIRGTLKVRFCSPGVVEVCRGAAASASLNAFFIF